MKSYVEEETEFWRKREKTKVGKNQLALVTYSSELEGTRLVPIYNLAGWFDGNNAAKMPPESHDKHKGDQVDWTTNYKYEIGSMVIVGGAFYQLHMVNTQGEPQVFSYYMFNTKSKQQMLQKGKKVYTGRHNMVFRKLGEWKDEKTSAPLLKKWIEDYMRMRYELQNAGSDSTLPPLFRISGKNANPTDAPLVFGVVDKNLHLYAVVGEQTSFNIEARLNYVENEKQEKVQSDLFEIAGRYVYTMRVCLVETTFRIPMENMSLTNVIYYPIMNAKGVQNKDRNGTVSFDYFDMQNRGNSQKELEEARKLVLNNLRKIYWASIKLNKDINSEYSGDLEKEAFSKQVHIAFGMEEQLGERDRVSPAISVEEEEELLDRPAKAPVVAAAPAATVAPAPAASKAKEASRVLLAIPVEGEEEVLLAGTVPEPAPAPVVAAQDFIPKQDMGADELQEIYQDPRHSSFGNPPLWPGPEVVVPSTTTSPLSDALDVGKAVELHELLSDKEEELLTKVERISNSSQTTPPLQKDPPARSSSVSTTLRKYLEWMGTESPSEILYLLQSLGLIVQIRDKYNSLSVSNRRRRVIDLDTIEVVYKPKREIRAMQLAAVILHPDSKSVMSDETEIDNVRKIAGIFIGLLHRCIVHIKSEDFDPPRAEGIDGILTIMVKEIEDGMKGSVPNVSFMREEGVEFHSLMVDIDQRFVQIGYYLNNLKTMIPIPKYRLDQSWFGAGALVLSSTIIVTTIAQNQAPPPFYDVSKLLYPVLDKRTFIDEVLKKYLKAVDGKAELTPLTFLSIFFSTNSPSAYDTGYFNLLFGITWRREKIINRKEVQNVSEGKSYYILMDDADGIGVGCKMPHGKGHQLVITNTPILLTFAVDRSKVGTKMCPPAKFACKSFIYHLCGVVCGVSGGYEGFMLLRDGWVNVGAPENKPIPQFDFEKYCKSKRSHVSNFSFLVYCRRDTPPFVDPSFLH
jgi:hypothetical protein